MGDDRFINRLAVFCMHADRRILSRTVSRSPPEPELQSPLGTAQCPRWLQCLGVAFAAHGTEPAPCTGWEVWSTGGDSGMVFTDIRYRTANRANGNNVADDRERVRNRKAPIGGTMHVLLLYVAVHFPQVTSS